ncbi:PREDICTED: isoprenoid synthase domain-containing protein-like [Phaethon lepturus]|uniref:isoprenoid synthase domain-containing protein-like n=1 Tax=Phaethon lepturus TaxID=97097 RepID=UPI0005308B9F|nr:PREDICTED: isoprenoid synthase domain-containing protein-like [Phaethon lepturus]
MTMIENDCFVQAGRLLKTRIEMLHAVGFTGSQQKSVELRAHAPAALTGFSVITLRESAPSAYQSTKVFFLITDNLSQQVCVITDVNEAIAQVGFLLHESLKSQIKVEAVSVSLTKNDSHLQNIFSGQCYNFVCVNDKKFAIQETQQLVDVLEKSNMPLLYPVVLILVHLDISENISFSILMEELTRIKKFAREVKKKNILVYSLLIQYKDHLLLQETVNSAAALIMALIKDRNPELIGQLLVA